MKLLAREPALTGAFIQATVLFLNVFVFHLDGEQLAAVQGLVLAASALLIRSAVVSAATAATVATQAAVKTAERLTVDTVGVAGQVTESAVQTATGAVEEVVEGVGGLAGGLVRGTVGQILR